mmetsp:Transcript_13881/g.20920  ORF Transcript_13881/g.20920 Transcript_13881/m.20920 type:complete len:129 (+) Transcript_13881:3-389(+)
MIKHYDQLNLPKNHETVIYCYDSESEQEFRFHELYLSERVLEGINSTRKVMVNVSQVIDQQSSTEQNDDSEPNKEIMDALNEITQNLSKELIKETIKQIGARSNQEMLEKLDSMKKIIQPNIQLLMQT